MPFNSDFDDVYEKTLLDEGPIKHSGDAREYSLELFTQGTYTPVGLTPLIIGREPDCGLTLKSPTVSRYHAAIYCFGKNFVVRDLHSTNGISLNNTSVTHSQIRPGDCLQIGEITIQILLGQNPLPPYQKEGAIVLLDVADFTRLCETHGNVFLNEIKDAIDKLEDRTLMSFGCPIKTLGDGLLVAFGIWTVNAPNYSPADIALSFAKYATVFIQGTLRKKHPEFGPVRTRIGLAWGSLNIVAGETLELSGESITMAEELEFANKRYGTPLLMNDTFVNKLEKKQGIQEVEKSLFRGISEPITVYTFSPQPYTPQNKSPLAETKITPGKRRVTDFLPISE